MSACPACGRPAPDGADRCPSCGSALGLGGGVDGGPDLPPPPSALAAGGTSVAPAAPGGVPTPAPRRVSGAWWLLPILLGWIGGLIAYFVNREADPAIARAMLLVGIGLSVLGVILLASVPTTP